MEKKEIEGIIAMWKEDIETVKSYWNKIPPQRLSGAYSHLADISKEIGICYILLGNKQEVLNWFKKATEYHRKEKENADKAKPEINYELAYKEFIYSAILTQDEKIIKDTAQHMCDVENKILNKIMKQRAKEFSMRLYHHGFMLANLIVGNDDKTRDHLEALKRHQKRLITNEYPITDAIEGILEKNTTLTKDGIDKILKRHVRLTRGRSLSEKRKLICIPAICILILAKLKGMDIREIYIESEYIPKFLFEENE